MEPVQGKRLSWFNEGPHTSQADDLGLEGDEALVYEAFRNAAPELLLGTQIDKLTNVEKRRRQDIVSVSDRGTRTSVVLRALQAAGKGFFSTGTGNNMSYTLQAVADVLELVKNDARLIDLIAPVLAEVEGPDGIHVDDVSAPLPCTIVLCEPWFR
jgi:hypothetical protein